MYNIDIVHTNLCKHKTSSNQTDDVDVRNFYSWGPQQKTSKFSTRRKKTNNLQVVFK